MTKTILQGLAPKQHNWLKDRYPYVAKAWNYVSNLVFLLTTKRYFYAMENGLFTARTELPEYVTPNHGEGEIEGRKSWWFGWKCLFCISAKGKLISSFSDRSYTLSLEGEGESERERNAREERREKVREMWKKRTARGNEKERERERRRGRK